jgi:hypothetical protein
MRAAILHPQIADIILMRRESVSSVVGGHGRDKRPLPFSTYFHVPSIDNQASEGNDCHTSYHI